MENNILFSIVIPLFQKERFLKKCLDSVLNQTYNNYEVIIVDDGSTDSSGLIAKKYARDYSQFHYYYKSNSGVSETRNFGIRKSKNSFVAFLDSDDYWDRNFLLKINELIQMSPKSVLFSTGFYKVHNSKLFSNENKIKSSIIDYNYFKYSLEYPLVNSSNVVIRKEILSVVNGFPSGMIDAEDLYTWAKVANIGGCCYTPEKLSYYNLDAQGWRIRKMKVDKIKYPYKDLINGEFYNYEYLAYLSYKKAILYLLYGYKGEAEMQIKPFKKNKLNNYEFFKYRVYRYMKPNYIYFLIRFETWLVNKLKLKRRI